MPAIDEAVIARLLSDRLPEGLEMRLRTLDRLTAETARGMDDLGRRAAGALEQILVKGADAEGVLRRLALSLSGSLFRDSLAGLLGGAGGMAGALLPGAGLVQQTLGALPPAGGAGWGSSLQQGPVAITVNAPGGDPRQVRLAVGQAAAQLARAVERGRREL